MIAAGANAGLGMVGNVVNYFAVQSAHHAAVQAANLNYNMKSQQVDQANVQLSQQQSENAVTNAVKYAQGFGRIATSASALGLGRSSTGQLLNANSAGYNRTTGIMDRNYDARRTSLQTELTGATIQRSTEISNAPHTNLGMLALGLAKSAAGGAADYAAMGGKFGLTPAGGNGLQGQSSGKEFGWT